VPQPPATVRQQRKALRLRARTGRRVTEHHSNSSTRRHQTVSRVSPGINDCFDFAAGRHHTAHVIIEKSCPKSLPRMTSVHDLLRMHLRGSDSPSVACQQMQATCCCRRLRRLACAVLPVRGCQQPAACGGLWRSGDAAGSASECRRLRRFRHELRTLGLPAGVHSMRVIMTVHVHDFNTPSARARLLIPPQSAAVASSRLSMSSYWLAHLATFRPGAEPDCRHGMCWFHQ